MSITYRVKGLSRVSRQLSALATSVGADAREFRIQEAQRILDKSLEYVPHETGALAASGEVFLEGNAVKVAYGRHGEAAAYALAIHEHPSSASPPSWRGKTLRFHQGGGRKYLERAWREVTSGTIGRLRDFLASAVSKRGI